MDSLFSIVKVVLILGVMYLIYKLTRPLTPEQLEDREKQKSMYQNLTAQRKEREKLTIKKLQADNPEKFANTSEAMTRITERIKSKLSESEIKAAISKEFKSINPDFDKDDLTLRSGLQTPIIIVDVTRIDEDWLVSAKYDPNYNSKNPEEIGKIIIFVAIIIGFWVFADTTSAIFASLGFLIVGALMKMNFGNNKSSSFDIAKNIERCLYNLKNEFSSTS